MDKSQYRKTFAQQILDVLIVNLPSGVFNQFYEGDPLEIPSSNLPAVSIVKTLTQYTTEATGLDNRRHFFNINLIFDKRSEFGQSSDQVILQNTLEQLAEGVDSTTGYYSPMSVVGILRTFFTLEGWAVDNHINVQYNMNVNRPNMLTQEAIIKADFAEIIEVPIRS